MKPKINLFTMQITAEIKTKHKKTYNMSAHKGI